ncbi:MAG: hypothetical protein Q9195_004227 [Heterodermia aff. obscurata]
MSESNSKHRRQNDQRKDYNYATRASTGDQPAPVQVGRQTSPLVTVSALSGSPPTNSGGYLQQPPTRSASVRPSNDQYSTQNAYENFSQPIPGFSQLDLKSAQTFSGYPQNQLSSRGASVSAGRGQLSHAFVPGPGPAQGVPYAPLSHGQYAHDQVYWQFPNQRSNQVQAPQIPPSQKYSQPAYTECQDIQPDGAYGYAPNQGLSLQGQTHNLNSSQSGTVQRQGRSDLHARADPPLNLSNQVMGTRTSSKSLSTPKRRLGLHLMRKDVRPTGGSLVSQRRYDNHSAN